ncbi:hypothetical protein MUA23_05460 [Mammaliicoccus sciuri]|uniref:hypothetical protein n=1 Tax=Mammaliicoccus sciuri TaxID=1296 RepID=UPI0021D006F1|nr:hypothetical protein [Mammaliicoccus sciuri]UXU72924.1 hypothetical protein MUA23_05460 [Mammaliicoccus sciuri]
MASGGKALYEYVIYKGDEIICAGTKEECAEKLGITKNSVYRLGTNAYKRNVIKHNLNLENVLIAEKVLISEIEAEIIR